MKQYSIKNIFAMAQKTFLIIFVMGFFLTFQGMGMCNNNQNKEIQGKTKPMYEVIDNTAFEKMLQDVYRSGISKELRHCFPGATLYSLKSGAVLLRHGYTRQTLLFSCKEDIVALIEECRASGKPLNSIVYNIFPYKEDFPSHVPRLIEELYEKLQLPPEYRNYSEKSMMKIDEQVEVLYNDPNSIAARAEIFPLLIAYTGEVIRHWVHGEWSMTLPVLIVQGGADYSAPDIIANGKLYSPWVIVQQALFNWKYRDTEGEDIGYFPLFMGVRSQLWDVPEFRHGRE